MNRSAVTWLAVGRLADTRMPRGEFLYASVQPNLLSAKAIPLVNLHNNKKAVLSHGNRVMPHAAVLFGLKFADNIDCKFESSQASKARLQSSKLAKHNLTQNGHFRSRVLESVERR